MWNFHKKINESLTVQEICPKKEFGDIFLKVKEFEEKVRDAEENMIQKTNDTNTQTLNEINPKFIRYLKLMDAIMKIKSQLQWFKEGDTNFKFFHSLIRGRGRIMFIHKIQENREWIQGDENIGKASSEYLQQMFTWDEKIINDVSLECIPLIVNYEKTLRLTSQPTMTELQVVFSMNPHSAEGPDDRKEYFFHKCWHIINQDLIGVVLAYFSGQDIPMNFSLFYCTSTQGEQS